MPDRMTEWLAVKTDALQLGQTPCRNSRGAPTLIDFAMGTSGGTSRRYRRRFYEPNYSFAAQIVAKVSTRPNKQGPQVVESIDAQMRASNVLGARGRGVQIAPPRPIESVVYGHLGRP